jgi:hypothetical protein
MTPTEVVIEVLRALDEQRWNDVAQFVDPLRLQELLDRELRRGRLDGKPWTPLTADDYRRQQPDMPLEVAEYMAKQSQKNVEVYARLERKRFDVDDLSDLDSMSQAEQLGRWLRSRDPNIQLRSVVEVTAPEQAEFRPDIPRAPRSVVGELVRDDTAFVLYVAHWHGPETMASMVTLAKSPVGWAVIPRGDLFYGGDSGYFIDRTSQRPVSLAVDQMAWTARRFDQQLPVELFPSVLERFRGTPTRVAGIIGGAPQRVLTAKPGGKWSIQEHLGHLLDLEELGERRLADFQARAEVLTAADMSNRKTEEAQHNEANEWNLQIAFAKAREELVANLAVLRTADIAHVALHPRLQRPMNVVEWVYFMCEHDDHHLARMRAQCIHLTAEIWDRVFGQ